MTQLISDQTVGELVTERPSRSRVFEQFGIDYCCGGKLPLSEACAKRGLDPNHVIDAIAQSDRTTDDDQEVDPKSMTLTDLADHIENTHHAYLKSELPRLTAMVRKVASVHGPNFPNMVELDSVFADFRTEIESHMMKEEHVLFPVIRQLELGEMPAMVPGGSVNNPIRMMRHEHDSAAQALLQMRRLTWDFTPPAEACNTFRAMIDGLEHLEKDTYRHIHKENNVLFPRSVDLENQILAQ